MTNVKTLTTVILIIIISGCSGVANTGSTQRVSVGNVKADIPADFEHFMTVPEEDGMYSTTFSRLGHTSDKPKIGILIAVHDIPKSYSKRLQCDYSLMSLAVEKIQIKDLMPFEIDKISDINIERIDKLKFRATVNDPKTGEFKSGIQYVFINNGKMVILFVTRGSMAEDEIVHEIGNRVLESLSIDDNNACADITKKVV